MSGGLPFSSWIDFGLDCFSLGLQRADVGFQVNPLMMISVLVRA